MDVSVLWFPLGAAAFLLAILDLSRAAIRKHDGWQVILFTSLSCGALALMCWLQKVNYWVQKRDWSALEDVVPGLTAVCSWALCLGIALNLLALWLHLRAEKMQKERA